MKRTTPIIGLIIIVIVVGGFFLFVNRAEAPKDGTSTPENTLQVPAPGFEGVVDEMIVNEPKAVNESGNLVAPQESTPPTETKTEETSTVTEEQTSVAVIMYTDDGFSPATLSVKKGGAVRFVNQSTGLMWVASAIHPTHSLYPGKTSADCLGSAFDQCRASGAGEVWEFTFNETGAWKYHNHIRASKTGEVVVE